eukprot:c11524_g1_i1.p1 GENE.c11524_g1_i1~~c11524_g1_i1.p1  ORF type:complete len:409 (+),score=87.15 c11524_g1_i1:1-1227(+)
MGDRSISQHRMTPSQKQAILLLILLGCTLQIFFLFLKEANVEFDDEFPRLIFPFEARKRLLWSSPVPATPTPLPSLTHDLTMLEENWPLVVTIGDGINPSGIIEGNKQFACIALAMSIALHIPRVHILPTVDFFRAKTLTFLQYLELANTPDHELVMFADTFDVLFLRTPAKGEIIKKFMEITKHDYANAVIISGECTCFPESARHACDNSEKLFPGPFSHVNSGQWLGTAGALRRFFRGVQDCYAYPRSWNTDQDVVHNFCFGDYVISAESRGLRCFLDNNTEYFRSMFENTPGCPGNQQGKLVTLSGDMLSPCKYDASRSCATDPLTKGQPLAVHYNGKNPTIIPGLLRNVATFAPSVLGSGPTFDNSFMTKCDKIIQIDGNQLVERCDTYQSLCGNFLNNGDVIG